MRCAGLAFLKTCVLQKVYAIKDSILNGFKFMVEISLKVKHASKWYGLRGWGRIKKYFITDDIERKGICSIKIKDNDKKIFREIRGRDEKDPIIKMDYESRLELGVNENETYNFEIKQLKCWDPSYYRFYLNHPERGIRLSMMLGLISLVLGIVSVFVSVRSEIYSLLLALYHL